MKRVVFLIFALAVWAGCTKSDVTRSKEFAHSGCASDATTRAGGDEDVPSLLILKYENGDLRVTRKNAYMNCSIKKGGIACDVSIDGNAIRYSVYEKEGPTANCICLVKEMSSLVTGLQDGKEYIFKYCPNAYTPITFTFKRGFHQIIDLDTL